MTTTHLRTPAAPTAQVASAEAEATLRDMAYVLRLTGKLSQQIRGDKAEMPAQPRLPRGERRGVTTVG